MKARDGILILLSVFSVLTGRLNAQVTKGDPSLPFKPLSEFGTDTVSFVGYNFLERSYYCYRGMTVEELISLVPFPVIEVSTYMVYSMPTAQRAKYPNVAIYLLQKGEKKPPHSTPFIVANLEKGLTDEDYPKSREFFRRYVKDMVIDGASVDPSPFMLYWTKVHNQHRRREYSAENGNCKNMAFKQLIEFGTDTLSYLQYNFTDRERSAYKGMTVGEFIDLFPLTILEMFSDYTYEIENILIYFTLMGGSKKYNFYGDQNSIDRFRLDIELENTIPFSKDNLNGLTEEEKMKYLIDLLKNEKIKSSYADDICLNLYKLAVDQEKETCVRKK